MIEILGSCEIIINTGSAYKYPAFCGGDITTEKMTVGIKYVEVLSEKTYCKKCGVLYEPSVIQNRSQDNVDDNPDTGG